MYLFFMKRRVVIEFSLVDESKNKTDAEIIKDVSEVFSNEEINIPWCNKVVRINFK